MLVPLLLVAFGATHPAESAGPGPEMASAPFYQTEGGGAGKVQPSAAQRYFISGSELMQAYRYLDAAEQFRLAIDEDPEYIDAYRKLAFVFTKMAESETEYYEDALEIYEELENKLSPDDVDANVEVMKNKAYVLTKMGETDEAIGTYEDILKLKPEDCTTIGAIAELHLAAADSLGEGAPGYQEHEDEAIAAYTKITNLCPDEMYAYNKLGELYYNSGQTDQAAMIYDALLKRDPENVDILGRLGYLWYKAGQGKEKAKKKSGTALFEKSLPYFKKLLALDPNRSRYRGLYADALKKTGHFEEAADEYMKIIAEDKTGKSDKLFCNVGFTYLDAKEYEKAIEMAMKAIADGAPSQGCLYCVWGKGLEMRGNAMVQDARFSQGISTYTDAKAKFTLALKDSQFGSYATKQISREDQLIERANQLKLKYEQDGQ